MKNSSHLWCRVQKSSPRSRDEEGITGTPPSTRYYVDKGKKNVATYLSFNKVAASCSPVVQDSTSTIRFSPIKWTTIYALIDWVSRAGSGRVGLDRKIFCLRSCRMDRAQQSYNNVDYGLDKRYKREIPNIQQNKTSNEVISKLVISWSSTWSNQFMSHKYE